MNKELQVGIADMKMTRQEGELITYALGSCVGITLYDPAIKLGALIHIMLPQSELMAGQQVFKFADSGIRETLRKMAIFGGMKSRYICNIAGGAKMFEIQGTSSIANIGERNVESVRKVLREEQIRIKRQEVGGTYARTMLLDVQTGVVKLRTFGRKEIIM